MNVFLSGNLLGHIWALKSFTRKSYKSFGNRKQSSFNWDPLRLGTKWKTATLLCKKFFLWCRVCSNSSKIGINEIWHVRYCGIIEMSVPPICHPSRDANPQHSWLRSALIDCGWKGKICMNSLQTMYISRLKLTPSWKIWDTRLHAFIILSVGTLWTVRRRAYSRPAHLWMWTDHVLIPDQTVGSSRPVW